MTGEAVLESDGVLKVLEIHATEVQAYAKRARELTAMATAPEQDALWDNLARDLDQAAGQGRDRSCRALPFCDASYKTDSTTTTWGVPVIATQFRYSCRARILAVWRNRSCARFSI